MNVFTNISVFGNDFDDFIDFTVSVFVSLARVRGGASAQGGTGILAGPLRRWWWQGMSLTVLIRQLVL